MEADIVIAGGGHNALVAGAYLAKAGLEVAVLEAAPSLGGGATTLELTLPGFLHDPYSTGHFGLMGNPIFSRDEIPLARYGLTYVAPDPVVTLPTGTGSISIWHDESRTAAEFAKYSREDAAAWRQLNRDWDLLAPVFRSVVGNPPAGASEGAMTPLARLKAFAGLGMQVLAKMSPTAALRMKAVSDASALAVIEERFKSPEVRRLLTWMVAITCQPVDQPGTGPLALVLPAGMSRTGWVNAVGGAIALPNALSAFIKDHGGQVETNAEVVEFPARDGRILGAVTADGRRFMARKAVLSSLHFTRLPALAPWATFPTDYLQRIEQWETGPGLFVVHLAVNGNPRVRTGSGSLPSVLTGSISPEGVRLQLDEVARNVVSFHDDIWLLAACSSIVDPTRAPEGKGVVKLMTMAPYAPGGDTGKWAELARPFADHLIKLYSRCVTGYVPGEELGRAVMTPVDIAKANPNFLGGSPQGGHALPSQAGVLRPVAGWARYRTPVQGLYQTGLSAHPGGAVNGWSGRNAARAMLQDLGLDADKHIPPV